MKYKFNNKNIAIGYIKQLLTDFNLPKCKICKNANDVDKLPSNSHFIKDGYLQFKKEPLTRNSNSETVKIKPYSYGDPILNLTKNFENKSLDYDAYTHTYLGDYLRFYRDYTGINLMPLYNCFTDEMPSNLTIEGFGSSLNDAYKIYMVPVKANTDYTVAFQCSGAMIAWGIYNTKYEPIEDSKIESIDLIWDKPKKITSPELKNNQLQQEKYLKLFIKIPKTIETSIVVLEGEYLNNSNFTTGDYIGTNIIDVTCLQLLSFNDGVIYPFSDKLIEYLLDYPIKPDDNIEDNIARLKSRLKDNKYLDTLSNIFNWTDDLDDALINYILKSNIYKNKFDILGYFDKDLDDPKLLTEYKGGRF